MTGTFFYKGKFFDNEEDFFRYANEWPKMPLTEESLTTMIELFKRDVLLNLYEHMEIKNGHMEVLLAKTFFESMELRNKK